MSIRERERKGEGRKRDAKRNERPREKRENEKYKQQRSGEIKREQLNRKRGKKKAGVSPVSKEEKNIISRKSSRSIQVNTKKERVYMCYKEGERTRDKR